MKNFFEFIGFLCTAAMSAVVIFLFIGKKEPLKGLDRAPLSSEYNVSEANVSPDAPATIANRSARSYAPTSSTRSKATASAATTLSTAAAERKLQNLYADGQFVGNTARRWKKAVQEAADEYTVKPQVFLAHVIVQSYLGTYTTAQFEKDAAVHAGERLISEGASLKRYRYGWSMEKLMAEHNLAGYFAPTKTVAAAPRVAKAAASVSGYAAAPKAAASKAPAKPTAKTLPGEEGFRMMVAKENGFSSWQGMERLADPQTKAAAQKRVKILLSTSRIR